MTRNINRSKAFFVFAFVIISFFVYQTDCHGHVNKEPPAFKYSRAANENTNIDNLDHGHEHHEHDHHEHDHHEHDHHEHDHHGHDHHEHDHHGHDHHKHDHHKHDHHKHDHHKHDHHEHDHHEHDHHGHDHHGHDHHGHDHHGHDHHEHDHHEHDHHEHDQHVHDQHGHEEKLITSSQYKNHEHKLTRSKLMIALYACGSTLLISIAPFIILFFIPLNNNGIENQSFLKILLGFASGSLLGDAFLHLIPHALSPHVDNEDKSHSHSHSADAHDHSKQTIVGLSILVGIMAFLLVEKLVRYFKGGDHAHAHSITINDKNDDNESKDIKGSDKCEIKSYKMNNEIKVAGYLNLAADFSHNFTDGLAIGASFLAGQNIGFITTLTILFHEVPHEIGDFAVLIQSGCSKQKAIFLQLFTAIGALSGTLISLLFESAISGIANSFILPFTAGGFIYIATVSIIPELKESTGLKQSAKEIIALISGVGMMVIIAYIE